jgi:hypothetical protein
MASAGAVWCARRGPIRPGCRKLCPLRIRRTRPSSRPNEPDARTGRCAPYARTNPAAAKIRTKPTAPQQARGHRKPASEHVQCVRGTSLQIRRRARNRPEISESTGRTRRYGVTAATSGRHFRRQTLAMRRASPGLQWRATMSGCARTATQLHCLSAQPNVPPGSRHRRRCAMPLSTRYP